MVVFSREYLQQAIDRFNAFENIFDQWDFLRGELEREQIEILLLWLTDRLDGQTAKERIKAINWLVNFVESTVKRGETAIKELKKTE